eukprot:6861665-Lingulodinium_polyedra.AAC.2
MACDAVFLDGKASPVSMIDWKSWKRKRVCRSSLSAECQAMAEALDTLNSIRLFWEVLVGHITVTARIYQYFQLTKAPEVVLVADCKELFAAVNRGQPVGLGLAEKRAAIEVLSIRQICSLSKRGVASDNLDRVLRTSKWNVVFYSNFTRANNIRKRARDGDFRKHSSNTSANHKEKDSQRTPASVRAMTPRAQIAEQLRQCLYLSLVGPRVLVEEGIHDVCLAYCDYDRRGYPMQNRPYRLYALQDLMWIPKEVVKYLRGAIWPVARCAPERGPDVEQDGVFPYFENSYPVPGDKQVL